MPDGSVNLIVTSPPFSLLRQKSYGNREQHEYVEWLAEFGALAFQKLRDDRSFVIDIGGAYERGQPSRSLYPFRVLLKFCDEVGFNLAEDFYWHNPSKLPSPIEWVNKRKIRAKDSVNTVWWLSKTPWPKADVTKVLAPYSDRMKKLIADPEAFYTPKKRPSGHDISAGFGKDNGGAIPPNLLSFPNTELNGRYMAGCKAVGQKGHPARFREVRVLHPLPDGAGRLVVDIFGGSATTGEVAEREERRWMCFEESREYVASGVPVRRSDTKADEMKAIFDRIMAGEGTDLQLHRKELRLAL